MKQKLTASLLVLLVLFVSVAVVILPTFFTKGISRIELRQDLELELILDKNHEIELVFFGYAGCNKICTPRLEELGQWYAKLPDETQGHLGLKFLDISTRQEKDLSDDFAKAFHPKFEGVFLDKDIIRLYTKAFNVYFSKSLMDKNELDHTAHLYLVKRDNDQKQLRFIYTAYPYDFKQIRSDIEELIHE